MSKKRPSVFIGSSAEGLPIAEAIQVNLDYACEVTLWSQGVFGLSGGTLESLVESLDSFDFAILVLTPDDLIDSRGKKQQAPRDNVLLELGLFIGGLGRKRTFIVYDRKADIKLPSDLAGVTPATYQPHESGNLQASLGATSTLIKQSLEELGARNRSNILVDIHGGYLVGRGDKEGFTFTVTNRGEKAVPPYHIAIEHPRGGSWSIFPSDVEGELLPEQKREHQCVVLERGDLADPIDYFSTDHKGNPISEELFSFNLILDHSDKVLYANNRLGRDFVHQWKKMRKAKSMSVITGVDAGKLTSTHDEDD